MEQCKGLIAGIDIGYSKIQASVYSYNSRNVQTVKLTEDSKEKTSLVNVVAECMRATGTSQIQSICVTIPDYHSDEISAVRDTLKKCGVSDGRWQVLSRVESFAYYAYRQKSELHAAGVALFDYTSEGIRCDYLAVRKNDNSNYLLQEHTGYTSDILKKAVISKELGLAENELCTFAEEYFSKRHVSAAYLTGEGFDVEKLPERFAKLMVTRRKAFVGQNLFAKGACFAAMEILKPEVFKNAFSGIWWSVSTLLTVGYGDIYPVTVLGKMFSIIITFLGVGMVAIPTGILSAGFVEQYSLIKKSTDYLMEKELKFIKLIITKDHNWNEKKVCELSLPRGLILAAVLRNGETLIKSGDIVFVFSKRYMADAQTISV